MSAVTFQLDPAGAAQPQTQTGAEGAADVNVASGAVAISQETPGVSNAVVQLPNAIAANAPTTSSSSAYEASRVVKAGPGILYSIDGYNSKVSGQFIQLFDSATLPAEGAVPKYVITVATVANFSRDFGEHGMRFSTGIVVCNSSTGPTKTIGSADCFFTARYV